MVKQSKWLILIVLVLVLVTSVTALVACKQETDPNDFFQQKGNTIQVILDSRMDPLVADSASKISNGYIDYRLKPGSPIPEPGGEDADPELMDKGKRPILTGYIFDGYYEGVLNDDGTVTFGDRWDFSRKVTESMTLYGKWFIQYKIRINYVLDGVVQPNDFKEVSVADNNPTIMSISTITWANHTFMQLYRDAECREELTISRTQPFEHKCTQENPVCNIYAKFIDGDWLLVRNATDLTRISAGVNLYFMDNIDMSELNSDDGRTIITVDEEYIGTIEGNGYTISNLHFKREGKRTLPIDYTTYSLGLFARLNGATIRNITFKDCSVTGVINRQNSEGYYLYGFIAGSVTGECTFDDVKFDNCELRAMQFNLPLLSAEQIEAERGKIETKLFVGEGSDYQPEGGGIVYRDTDTSAASQAVALARIATTQALLPKSTTIQSL